VGINLGLCYTTTGAPVSANAGILTLRTGTTGAERECSLCPDCRRWRPGFGLIRRVV